MHTFPKFFILSLMELPDRVAAAMQKSLSWMAAGTERSPLNFTQAEVNLFNLKVAHTTGMLYGRYAGDVLIAD